MIEYSTTAHRADRAMGGNASIRQRVIRRIEKPGRNMLSVTVLKGMMRNPIRPVSFENINKLSLLDGANTGGLT